MVQHSKIQFTQVLVIIAFSLLRGRRKDRRDMNQGGKDPLWNHPHDEYQQSTGSNQELLWASFLHAPGGVLWPSNENRQRAHAGK